MNEITLTKDASNLFSALYGEYKKRKRQGQTKSDAAYFDNSKIIHADLLPKWNFDDVDSACAELRHAGLLCGQRADGYEYYIALSDKGIIYGETKFPRGASKVFAQALEWIQAIRSLLPW